MPRIERPISRWISTVRPSGRPLETSRCLRSPVEAGSIPYSAVSQPRPWPAIQRGTDSCDRRRADHARLAAGDQRRAGRRGARSSPRSSSGGGRRRPRPPLRSRRHAAACSPQVDVLDRAERHLQEARAERGERVDVAGREERVVALAAGRVAEPARAEDVLDLAGERRAGGDDLDAAAERALEDRAHERVVGAAEDHGVDARLAQRRAVGAHGVDDAAVEREAALDDRGQVRARDRGDVDERVGVADRALVGAARDRGRRGEQPDAAVARRRHRLHRARAARRRGRRRRASSPSAACAAPAAPPPSPSCRRRRAA